MKWSSLNVSVLLILLPKGTIIFSSQGCFLSIAHIFYFELKPDPVYKASKGQTRRKAKIYTRLY